MNDHHMPVEKVAAIAAMRRMGMSSLQIAFPFSMPLATVTHELRRLGLNRLPRLEPRPPVIRYEPKSPGDMSHLDVKKLGKIDGAVFHSDQSGPGWPARAG